MNATTTACPSCGTAVTLGDRFCGVCGAETSATVSNPWLQVVERLQHATLGDFAIVRELGRGGMAAVYLAHDIALNRKVAIKVMSPAILMGEGMVERFQQEAMTVAKLHHPHIVTIHGVKRMADLHFFVMQFIEGRSLEHVLHDAGPLPFPIVRALLFHVGNALAYAHRRGVIHRDVKPANILLDEDGNGVVTDFGIAKVAELPSHTQTGSMVGTPAYMSPEQCVAGDLTWSSDQYSLGVVAYEMLAGQVPFTGPMLTVLHAHTEKEPAPIRQHRPDCPADLEAAVLRMLAKAPDARWPTMADALRASGATPLPDDSAERAQIVRWAALDAAEVAKNQLATPISPTPFVRSRAPEAPTRHETTASGAAAAGRGMRPIWIAGGVATAAMIAIVAVLLRGRTPAAHVEATKTDSTAAATPSLPTPVPTPTPAESTIAPPTPPAKGAGVAAVETPNTVGAKPAAVPKHGTLRLVGTVPAGVDVTVDGNAVVDGADSVSLAPGQHTLLVRGEGFSRERPIEINAGERVSVDVGAMVERFPVRRDTVVVTQPRPAPAETVAPPAPSAADIRKELNGVATGLFNRLEQAIAARSFTDFQAAFPGMTNDQRSFWRAFVTDDRNFKDVSGDFTVSDVSGTREAAEARFSGKLAYTESKKPRTMTYSGRATLKNNGGAWYITSMTDVVARKQ